VAVHERPGGVVDRGCEEPPVALGSSTRRGAGRRRRAADRVRVGGQVDSASNDTVGQSGLFGQGRGVAVIGIDKLRVRRTRGTATPDLQPHGAHAASDLQHTGAAQAGPARRVTSRATDPAERPRSGASKRPHRALSARWLEQLHGTPGALVMPRSPVNRVTSSVSQRRRRRRRTA